VLPYSQGQKTEGRVNKLKCIKRSIDVRAGQVRLVEAARAVASAASKFALLSSESLISVYQILGRTVETGQTLSYTW
jgi:hypothetical protein